jgi:hypothetical protein
MADRDEAIRTADSVRSCCSLHAGSSVLVGSDGFEAAAELSS